MADGRAAETENKHDAGKVAGVVNRPDIWKD
jgi:hypothetical protein